MKPDFDRRKFVALAAMTPALMPSLARAQPADAPKPATGGEVTLYINDRPVGKGRMDHTVPIRFSAYAGMDVGRDNGGVVDLSYEDKKPFAFTGTVKKVVFDVKPHLSAQDEEALHAVAQHGHAGHGLSA